jgi:signal transduction histidine kinase
LIVWSLYRLRVRQLALALGARFDERLAERTRIARDLHDTLLQTIQGSKLVVEDALEQPHDAVRTRRAMEQLAQWLPRAVQEGRTALDSLRSSSAATDDLRGKLQRMTEELRSDGRMQVRFSVVGELTTLHPVISDELFLVSQEAIRNASLHARASHLEIELNYGQDLIVRVTDDGIGMDAATIDHGKGGHFGLQGMRERASRVGAKLSIRSSPGSGTEIVVVVPGSIAYRGQHRADRSGRQHL